MTVSYYENRKKLQKVDRLLSEVKSKLKKLGGPDRLHSQTRTPDKEPPIEGTSSLDTTKQKVSEDKTLYHDIEDFQAEYERLYVDFLSGDVEAVINYIESKDKDFLTYFCKENNLSINSSRASKKKISAEVVKWMSRRKAITKKT